MFRALRSAPILIAAGLLSLLLLLAGCSPILPGSNPTPALAPREIPEKLGHTAIDPGAFTGMVIVKFVEGSDVRLRNGKLVSSVARLDELDQVLTLFPVDQIERQFAQDEDQIARGQAELEAGTGQDVADLNLYYRLAIQDRADAEALIDALNALPLVELAYPETSPAPPPQLP
jgi:hypothetical protein